MHPSLLSHPYWLGLTSYAARGLIVAFLALWLAPASRAGTVLFQASNTIVRIGLPVAQLEFENPLAGVETVLGHRVLEWRDADYAPGPPPWYDDWIVSHPGAIDGDSNEIWMRAVGHSVRTTTTVPSSMVSVHLTGDQNDGGAQVLVDGVEVARFDMNSATPETAVVVVYGLSNTTHAVVVDDIPLPGQFGMDAHVLGAAALEPLRFKWIQPPAPATPTNVFYGWNEVSIIGGPVLAADDWVCTNAQPVTEVSWWGSFLDWRSNTPPRLPGGFMLTFWSDVPAGPADPPFSHPGVALWQVACTNFTVEFAGWDFDPRTQSYEAGFRFRQVLQPQEWFRQDPGPTGSNVFWLSIGALYTLQPTEFPWGWKTRPRDRHSAAPDDAVRIFNPTVPQPGMPYGAGEPIWWPEPTNSWDLAFELISQAPQVEEKWLQRPDLTPLGIDVNAGPLDPLGPPYLLADDFLCTNSGPLTDITIWNSWWHDMLPGDCSNVLVRLSIHRDIPAQQSPTGYSMPGELLWMRVFQPGQFQCSTELAGTPEGWLDPPQAYEPVGDTICFRYDFHLDSREAFVQQGSPTNPTVYWLDVQAQVLMPGANLKFGWKSSTNHWNDDAVWVFGVEPVPAGTIWNELRYPQPHPQMGQSMDLAFRLASPRAVPAQVKWSQPPGRYTLADGFDGWNELSVYDGQQLVADDWVCTNATPVTDLHWWGSFLNWGEVFPPERIRAFHIAFWTDVPAGPVGFSHPGEVIWENVCTNFTVEFAGWDFDPRRPEAPPEACFKFDQLLPNEEWFRQAPGTNIYWVSIAAAPGEPTLYPWGWKMRPRDTHSPAPDDAVRISIPTAPRLGAQFIQGAPIEFPAGRSWDAAFALTTRDVEPDRDFGDAPDPSYPTLTINNGANHVIVPGFFLGAQIDAERDGQPNPTAIGDDLANLDDEDGVAFTTLVVPGQPATVQVTASARGFLDAWVDFGADGSWGQIGDQAILSQVVTAGVNTLTVPVPPWAVPGQTFTRFRFSSVGGLPFAGPARDGEVEDYRVTIEREPANDLGDAPDSRNHMGVPMTAYPRGGPPGVPANFPTVFQQPAPPFGPLHLQPTAVAFLGNGVSFENEADLGPDQDGVNNLTPPLNISDSDRFDDGVLFPLSLPHCLPTRLRYVVNVAQLQANPFFVNVWFDWNRNGDWNDILQCQAGVTAPEWAVQNQPVSLTNLGQLVLATPPFFAWHPAAERAPVWMRITLSEQPWPPPGGAMPMGGEGPVGGYQFGETEDYYIEDYLTDVWDFGDAPEQSGLLYPTTLTNNGARHVVVPGFRLGVQIDFENDGLPSPNADGDDLNNLGDEDGVTFTTPLVPGRTATVAVVVSAAGKLDAWLDFNRNGSWADLGEQIFTNQSLGGGTNRLTFNVPAGAATAATYARFRFSSVGGLPFTGPATDGEVEDYQVPIAQLPVHDLGDAPDSSNAHGVGMTTYPSGVAARYPTVWLVGSPPYGPIHQRPMGLAFLGTNVSGEFEADRGIDMDLVNNLFPPTNAADQDGADDGLIQPVFLPHCAGGSLELLITLPVPLPAPMFINAWFDWNRDGDWNDVMQCPDGTLAPEWACTNFMLLPQPGPFPMTFRMPFPLRRSWHPPGPKQPIWLRLTLAEVPWAPTNTVGGEGPIAGYQFGETEDYYLTNYVDDWDFGDAPAPYQTLLANDGARHFSVSNANIYLGTSVDLEGDGQPHPQALGDDLGGTDDEDGVTFTTPLVPGLLARVEVVASAVGTLNAWVDFASEGSWAQAGDQIFTNENLAAGTNSLSFLVPTHARPGSHSFARFRFSGEINLSFTGPAYQGEVEDYRVSIEPLPDLDWGDAPDRPYPTLAANNGAHHVIVPAIHLGQLIDPEPNGQPHPQALGDDLAGADDEDGVTFLTPLAPGRQASVQVVASVNGVLNAWIDFGADGSWAEPGDQIALNTPLLAGTNVVGFPVPPNANAGSVTFARFRFNLGGNLRFEGFASEGEVEDYWVRIEPVVVKWVQPPDLSPQGLDVLATWTNILADDFLCTNEGAITDLHIWGSWLQDRFDTNVAFWIGIWSDVPQPPGHHPGQLLWSSWFYPGQYRAERVAEGPEQFYDPNRRVILGPDTMVWRYDFLPKTAFYQQGQLPAPRIYWLSVMAVCSRDTLFGWKTTTNHWQDAAVFGHVRDGTPVEDWEPMLRPEGIAPIDLAFAVTTIRTNWPPFVEPKQFVQPPDTSLNGLDVLATYPTILADDFICTNKGWITNIIVWSSWLNDLDNPNTSFLLGLWSDVPATREQPSHPGKLMVSRWFRPGEYLIRQVAPAEERFYDPNLDDILGLDHQIWQYEFPATNTFWQLGSAAEPRIYWLSVVADTTNQLFGWKTSTLHTQDAAVYGRMDSTAPLADWRPLHYPRVTNRIDLAFGVSTDTRAPLITSISRTNNLATIYWLAWPGQRYRLEYRLNVGGPGWIPVGGDVVALGYTASQDDLTGAARCFYRVVWLP